MDWFWNFGVEGGVWIGMDFNGLLPAPQSTPKEALVAG
jgi:hypothetical protein